MGFPVIPSILSSLAGAYTLAWHSFSIQQHGLGFVSVFTALWGLQLVCWAFWRVLLWPKVFSPLRHLPQPTGGSFFMGHSKKILRESSGNPALEWINSIPNDGLIRYLGVLNEERLFPTTPKALAEVLVSKNYTFVKPSRLRYFLTRVLGHGILMADGDEHRMQRRTLMPAFAFRHVKDLYPVFWAKSCEAVQTMATEIRRREAESHGPADTRVVLEIQGWASRATLDIIGVAGLGCDFGAIRDPQNELSQTYNTLMQPGNRSRLMLILSMITPRPLLPMISSRTDEEVRTAGLKIRSVCRDLVRSKREKMSRKELTDTDILSVALESDGFDEEQLVDQLMTFLGAGHETSATALTWAIYLLCLHRDVQSRLRAEVRAKIQGGSAAAVSSTDIDHMPYLTAVCNEVLRYYAPVPLTVREAACDSRIGQQVVPKGTQIMLVPWALNRSTALWGPNAGRFDPDRWMPKFEGDVSAAAGGCVSNYGFMTFLHGPRSCIGMSFAKAEFACLLAAWVGMFDFEIQDERLLDERNMEMRTSVTSKPAKGLYVKTRVVEGWE